MIKAMNAKKGKETSTRKQKNYNGKQTGMERGKKGKKHKVQYLMNLIKVQKC